jgi:two-component system sensor histidine kinase YesM
MIRHIHNNTKIATKIIVLYSVIALVFVIVSCAAYFYTTHYLEKEIGYYSDFATRQFCDNFQTTISNIQLDVFGQYNVNILLSKNGSRKIATGVDAYYQNIIRGLDIKNALDEMLYLATYINWVAFVDIYGNIYTASKVNNGITYNIAPNLKKDFHEVSLSKGGVIWKKARDGSIMLMRVIYDLSVMHYCGYAIVNINQDILFAQFKHINSRKNGDFVALDSQNEPMVFTASAILPVAKYFGEKYQHSAAENLRFKYAGNTYIGSKRKLAGSRLAIINLVNLGYVNEKFNIILRNLIGISTVFLLIVLGLVVLVFKGLTVNVNRLVFGLGNIAKGDFATRINIHTKDEIGFIAQNVNEMVERIAALIARVADEKKAKQEARYQMLEFRYSALQEKINPHFVFNVLEMINSFAKLNNDHQVSEIVCKFARVLRGSIDRTHKFCLLREEIDYIENYLSIYKEMYQDKIVVNYEVDIKLAACRVPTFILQPIIENSIVHGIEPKIAAGIITIKSLVRDGKLILSVTDDGIGIPEEKLKQLLAGGENPASRKRVGISNVRERIKLLYGPEYGLEIFSASGKFTRVEITLPYTP